MNTRLKQIRQDNNLTMEKFGQRIGLGRSAVSLLESGRSNVTEQTLLAVCREFHVNEEWFRTGKGEKYKPTDTQSVIAGIIDKCISEGDDSFRVKLITEIANLSNEQIEFLANLVTRLADENKKD